MIDVEIEPTPLPRMRKGEYTHIRIHLRGGLPGESIVIELVGAMTMRAENRTTRMGTQATSFYPMVSLSIVATRDGSPTIIVSSPQNRLPTTTVNGHFVPLGFIVPPSDKPSTFTPPPMEALHKEQHVSDPSNQPRGWLFTIMGVAAGLLFFGGYNWWMSHLDDQAELAVTSEPTPEPEPVVEATPEPEPEPVVDPTNCMFLNGNRPQVGDKYVLTCYEGWYIATGEYKGDGVFAFSGFETHDPYK